MNNLKLLESDANFLSEIKADSKRQFTKEEEEEEEDEEEEDDDDMYLYDEPPAYNITNRLKEINNALAMESIPDGYEDRQRKVIFRENPVDFEIPATPNYSSDDNDDGYGDSTEVSDDLTEEMEGDCSKTVNKKNEVNRRVDEDIFQPEILKHRLAKVKADMNCEEEFSSQSHHISVKSEGHFINSSSFADNFTSFMDQHCAKVSPATPSTNYVQPNSVANEIGQLLQRFSKLSFKNNSEIHQADSVGNLAQNATREISMTRNEMSSLYFNEKDAEKSSSNLNEHNKSGVEDTTKSVQDKHSVQNEQKNQTDEMTSTELVITNEAIGHKENRISGIEGDGQQKDQFNSEVMPMDKEISMRCQNLFDLNLCSGEKDKNKIPKKEIPASLQDYNHSKSPIFTRFPAKPKMTTFRWKRAMRQLHMARFTEQLSKSNEGMTQMNSTSKSEKELPGLAVEDSSLRSGEEIQTEGNGEIIQSEPEVTSQHSANKTSQKDGPTTGNSLMHNKKQNNRLLTARPVSSSPAVSIEQEKHSINLEETMIMASRGKFHVMKMDAFQSLSNSKNSKQGRSSAVPDITSKRPSTSPVTRKLDSNPKPKRASEQLGTKERSLMAPTPIDLSRQQHLIDERLSPKMLPACRLRPLTSVKRNTDTDEVPTERRYSAHQLRGQASTFKLTPEQKNERLRKLQILAEERQQKQAEEAEEKARKREQVDKVYKEWLQSKKHLNMSNSYNKQKQSHNDDQKAPKLHMTTCNGTAFQNWLQQKRIQKREEARIAEIKRKVEEKMFCIRKREDNEKAFRRWLNTKNKTERLRRSQRRQQLINANSFHFSGIRRSAKPS